MATVSRELAETTEAAATATTYCEAFQITAASRPDAIAVRNEDGSVQFTWREYADRVRKIAAGLAGVGVRRGDTVALMLTNRPEFHLCDAAAMHLGATPFSLYNTSPPEQIAYIFSNAENRVVITEQQFVERVIAARGDRPEPSLIVCVDGRPDGTITLEELEQRAQPGFDFEAAWRAVTPDDVLTLIYTSGTTGRPKGVELTHANMLADARAVASVLPMRPGARITSYLPSAHAADRWSAHYNGMLYGFEVVTVADLRQIGQLLPSIRPTVWGGVPRVFEKIKAAIEAAIAAEQDEQRRAGIQKAIEVGLEKVRLEQAGKPVPEELARTHAALDEQVLSKLREKIGLDQAEWIICGAAPLPREVHEFLLAIGLPLVELFGCSECSCVVTICHPDDVRIGTVGRALPGVEIRVADDGEMLIRGPIVMRGYRKEPDKTREVLDEDGWLHTGDVAEIDEEGYVRIVDRKKELIINSAGKNMSPSHIESEIKSASPLIGQAVCIGDRRPYNVALIVLDPEAAAAWAQRNGLADPSPAAVAADERAKAEIAAAVDRANRRLARVEQIKRYHVLPDVWLPGGEELTPTMKLKRKPIEEKYAEVIEALYAG